MKLLEFLKPSAAGKAATEARPQLTNAIREAARLHGIPEQVVHEHLGKAVLDSLEHFGTRFVTEMGALLARSDALREQVHVFYEKVFAGERNPDVGALERMFAELNEELSLLDDPQTWAEKQSPAPEPAAHPAVDWMATSTRELLDRMNPAEKLKYAVHDSPVIEQLPSGERDAVGVAAAKDPWFVRRAVASEIDHGPKKGVRTPWRIEAMDAFCDQHGITGQQRADLENGLRKLIAERRRQPMPEVAGDPIAKWTPEARERAKIAEKPVEALGLPEDGAVAAALLKSANLRQLAADSPDHFAKVVEGWLRYTERKTAEGKQLMGLDRYVLALMRSHVRGTLGELTAVFRLGKDFWVLKSPSLDITTPGTDFVVVAKATGEIWFCDNKAVSHESLSRVSSLTENLPRNLEGDLAEFGALDTAKLLLPEPDAEKIAGAIAGARVVSQKINELLAKTPEPERRNPEVQREIGRICRENGVRLVVTNAGGELTALSGALNQLGIDLANLNSAGPVTMSGVGK